MILPTMTLDEVWVDVYFDFETVRKKAHVQAGLFQQQLQRSKKTHEVKAITYKTSLHNVWTIMFKIFKDEVHYTYYIESEDKSGVCVYTLYFMDEEPGISLVKMNGHFFAMYNERLHLNLVQPADKIKHFFKHNFVFKMGQTEEMEDGTCLVNFIYDSGIGIGWYDNTTGNYLIKTFIANETLNKGQRSLKEYLLNQSDAEEFSANVRPEHLKNRFE